jgi:hypothetical protein
MSAGQTPNRTKWAIAVSCVALLGVMCAVIVLAKGQGEDSDSLASAGAQPVREAPADAGRSAIAEAWPPKRTAAADLGCGPPDPDKPPRFEWQVPGKKLDLGTLKQGVRLDREASFRNAGTGPLCVSKVTSGCGCLKVHLVGDKRRFEPGESGKVILKIDTTGRQGTVRKRVSATTNDPEQPTRSFTVSMDVNAGLMISPRYIDFGNQAPGTPVTRDFFLLSPKDEPEWELVAIQGGRRSLKSGVVEYTFEVAPVEDPKYRKIRVSLTHPGLETIGPFRDPLVITTSHPDRGRLIVQSSINVVPRIRCRSNIVSLGFVRPGHARPPTRARIQAGLKGLQFKITGVEVVPLDGKAAGPAGTGFVADFGRDQRGWYVDVRYDGRSRKPGLLDAELVVRTDDALQPELRVRVRATVQKPR